MTTLLLLLAAFAAGVITGAFWRWLAELAEEADEYDGIEHPPEPRVMPKIWDGYDRKDTNT